MKNAKKCVSVLLAVLMVFACLPVFALASTETGSVSLQTDWQPDENNRIKVDVYFDDYVDLYLADLVLTFDETVFSIQRDGDVIDGADARAVDSSSANNRLLRERNLNTAGEILFAMVFAQELWDAQTWASYGATVNADHFHMWTVYLTVDDLQTFASTESKITISGSCSALDGSQNVSSSIIKAAEPVEEPSDPRVVLATDWEVDEYNAIALDIFFDDAVNMTSYMFYVNYDKDVFGTNRYDIVSGVDAKTVERYESVINNDYRYEVNETEDGLVIWGGYFLHELWSSEKWAAEGLDVNGEHFHALTIYLTVEDAEAFENETIVIDTEGSYDFESTTNVSIEVSDRIEKIGAGHSWGDGVVTAEPTHTEDGEKTYTCFHCGDTKTEVIPALGHDYKAVVTAPTCTEQGFTTYTCACGDSYVADYVDALGHDYKTVVTAPTCTEQGFTTYTCECGDTYIADEVAALGHDYKTVVTAPTCTEKGYTTYTCSCGDSYVADYVDALGHDYKSVVTAPTCTEQGYTTYTCSCGDTYVADYVDALGHDYKAVVTAPTCTEKGYTTYTCSCGDSYKDDYVDAKGHTEKIIPAVAPTCSKEGLTEGVKCADCGEVIVAQKKIAKQEHVDEDVDNKCDHCGAKVRTCDCICHATDCFNRFFYKLIQFFRNLFGIYSECKCGVVHK